MTPRSSPCRRRGDQVAHRSSTRTRRPPRSNGIGRTAGGEICLSWRCGCLAEWGRRCIGEIEDALGGLRFWARMMACSLSRRVPVVRPETGGVGTERDRCSVGLFGGDTLVDPTMDRAAADSDGGCDGVDGGATGFGVDGFERESKAGGSAHLATSSTSAVSVVGLASWWRWSTAR